MISMYITNKFLCYASVTTLLLVSRKTHKDSDRDYIQQSLLISVRGIALREASPSKKRMRYAEEWQCEAKGNERDKRERNAENRVDEIGCSCILTSWWEDCDEVRLPSFLSPDLFICLRPMQRGCLRHPLDSPEIQFTDGERAGFRAD